MVAFLGLLFLGAAALSFAVALGVVGGPQRKIQRRVRAIANPSATSKAAQTAVRFQEQTQSTFIRYLTSPTAIAKLKRNLELAGSPDDWPMSKVLSIKLMGTLVGIAVVFLQLSRGLTLMTVIVSALAILVGYFGADVIVQRLATSRQESIQKALPDVLDQVTISLEAGLAFEGALAHIGQQREGPISDEIVRTIQDIRLGVNRRDAYTALAARNNVPELDRFVRALAQADKHGVSISQVVRTQAEEMRFARKKRAEAAAARIPVKVLFPLLLCIFPVLFAVILTPAGLSIADAF